jgi:hypothetical protein
MIAHGVGLFSSFLILELMSLYVNGFVLQNAGSADVGK